MLQLARSMAAEVDGDLHTTIVSPAQAGSPEHERLLAPLVRMHRAARDVWYVYTGIYRNGRIYWVLDTAYHYRVPGNDAPRRSDHEAVSRARAPSTNARSATASNSPTPNRGSTTATTT